MPTEFPTGVVTLVFTDIQGSTELWERLGDRFHAALEAHNAIFRESLVRWRGYEVKPEGDAFMLSFARPSDAVLFAIEVQQRLTAHPWSQYAGSEADKVEILVRMGIHTGEPLVGHSPDGKPDYFGPDVNRAARVSAAGHGGQILLSAAARLLTLPTLPTEVELIALGLHRLKGLERPENIFQVIHPDLPTRTFPPLKTLDNLIHNLPVQLTTFVGREKELREVSEIIERPEVRLLTLVGPGGTGKTRLALQIAAELVERFLDGVWFVELAATREPEEAISAITSALGLSFQPDREVRQQLLTFLAEKRLLLVLDNSEQLSKAGPLIADILRSAPQVECLITSRSVLRIRGETVYELAPLPTPPLQTPEVANLTDTLAQYESVALFVERAQAVDSRWKVTEDNAAAVAELCRRLEGMPLAVELAAARIRSMTPQDILHHLDHRFRLLAGKSVDLPERQRTLRGAIDWSYDLLNDEEKKFLAQLSIFAGGFCLEAAEAVTNNPFAFDLIPDLRDKSLLSTMELRGSMRYRMLDSVQEYATEKLQEFGDAAREVGSRHAQYFLQFSEQKAASVRTLEEAEALTALGDELDNLRAAMGWAESNGVNDVCARLAIALYEFLYHRGYWDEELDRVQLGLAAAERAGSPPLTVQLLRQKANILVDLGEYAQAQEHAARSLAMARASDDRENVAPALNLLGVIALQRGHFEEAETELSESLALHRDLGNPAGEAMTLHNLAHLAQKQRETGQARELYEKSLVLRRQVGDRRGVAETLINLGVIAQEGGDLSAARQLFEECLIILESLGDQLEVAICKHNLGEVAMAEGDRDRAVACLNEAELTFRRLGSLLSEQSRNLLRQLSEDPS